MSCAVERCRAGAKDAAGDRRYPPAPVREAELPLRGRGGAPRAGGAQLLRGEPDEVRDTPQGGGRAGAPGDGALPAGAHPPRDGGELRAQGAHEQSQLPSLSEDADAFSTSHALYEGLVGFLRGSEATGLAHEDLESRLELAGRELCRQLLQDHLDVRAAREVRAEAVTDAEGACHNAVERGHARHLGTIFGEVAVTRLAYRAKGTENLYPADAVLNLPSELHSHGLRERCAIEASRGSYEEAKAAIERATGIGLGKRQVEELTRRAARDVDAFYHNLGREPAEESDALVISADGKGIVMRPDALRPATKKAAQATAHKLKTRLSKGEKRDRKRVAELAAVYDVAPVVRTPADILCPSEDGSKPPAPEAKAKWLTASVVEDAQQVIAEAFTEALRRDPEHNRPWVALVDGANHQINAVRAEAKAHGVTIHIVVDLVHVLEYLWDSAWSFFEEGDTGAEAFVAEKALAVLEGKAGIVAGAIRRKATALRLDASQRKKADECARYLKNKAPYLDYPTALARGWPIATGVIEGAVRHIVRDRFDITGARWSLDGAEAMLKLRAVRANGDWSAYWRYHLTHQRERVHAARYAAGVIPQAA